MHLPLSPDISCKHEEGCTLVRLQNATPRCRDALTAGLRLGQAFSWLLLFSFPCSSSALCLPLWTSLWRKWKASFPPVCGISWRGSEESLPSFTLLTTCHLFRANLSWTTRKHDFEKGKPFWDFKPFMDYQFLIKSWFWCTKFINVQFYFILPSKLMKK